MFRKKKKAQVLVVGASPVGLFTAIVLEQRGIKVDIIDGEWRPRQRPIAVTLHPAMIPVLDAVGLFHEFRTSGRRIDAITFYDGIRSRQTIELAHPSSLYSELFVIQEYVFETLLRDKLKSMFGREVKWSHRLARLAEHATGVSVEIQRLEKQSMGYTVAHMDWVVEQEFAADYAFVIGASDGGESIVRQSIDNPVHESGKLEQYAIFDATALSHSDSILRVVFNGDYSALLWPMPREHWQWAFQQPAPPSRRTRRITSVSEEIEAERAAAEFEALVAQRAPWFAGWGGSLLWSTRFLCERQFADSIGSERCWLIGDAAHTTTPIDIHGAEFELHEAQQLAVRIAMVLNGEISIRALREFDHAEETRHQRLLAFEGQFVAGARAPAWVRDHSLQIPRCLPATGNDLVQLADGLGLHL